MTANRPASGAGRHRRRRQAVVVAVLVAAALAALGALRILQADAVPVLSPVYSIETVSKGHHNSVGGLTMGQPGAPQVPTPVDVDGDSLSDIIVAVNLVDVSALVQNPPDVGSALAPNIEITRDPTAVARCNPELPVGELSRCTPPLKVQVKFTVKDLNNLEEDTVVRFGYDTGNNGALPTCPAAPCDPLARSGSIPPYFKAVVAGLEDVFDPTEFFNPIEATVSTRGLAGVGQALNHVELAGVTNGYDGPLDLVGSIGTAAGLLANGSLLDNVLTPGEEVGSDLRFGYRPWPGDVKVTYKSDDEGKHVTYEHERMDEVDLNTRILNETRDGRDVARSVLEARVDRLPRRIALDFDTGDRKGKVRYRAKADGRLPDVAVTALSEKVKAITKTELEGLSAEAKAEVMARLEARAGARASAGATAGVAASLFVKTGENEIDVGFVPQQEPLVAELDVEALPPSIGADWAFPQSGDEASALFCAGKIEGSVCDPAAQGIGAIEGTVKNYYGDAAKITPFVAEQQQVMSFQTAPGGVLGRESLIHGRIERLRQLAFDQSTAGFNATAKAGDGELPLQLFFSTDDRLAAEPQPLVRADATVVPLPDSIKVALEEPGADQKDEPLQLVYESSKSVDVNSHLEVRKPGAGPLCGNKGTLCGDLRVRHLPARITAKVGTFPASSDLAPSSTKFPETRVELDAVPRPGGTRPDFFADLSIGQDDNIPLFARAELLGFPEHTSIRAREGLDETLDRVEFHACKRLFDASPQTCQSGTEQDIGALSFSVRNWFARPAGLPILNPTTPLYGTIAVRGRAGTSDVVDFEATGKVTDISRLVYRNTQKIFGVSTKIGGGKQMSALVDVGNVDVKDDDPANGRLDITGETTITPLPATLDLCVRHIGQKLQTLSEDAFTDPCETDTPFADLGDPAVTKTPLSIHYNAASQFNVSAKASLLQRGLNAARSDDHQVKGSLDVVNLPKEMTTHFDAPPTGVKGPIRAVYEAQSGAAINADFGFESTDADLVCQDPRRPALGKKALCAGGRIENLPTKARFRYDPTVSKDNLLVETNTSINLKKLSLSSVEGVRKSDDPLSPLFNVIVPKVLVAEGEVNDLPKKIEGTLDMPKDTDDAPTVDIQADPPVGQVKVTARNFIAPDPFIKPVPDRAIAGFSAPTQTVFFRQRGELFKAEANIGNVKSAGYRTVKDAAGKALDTKVVSLGFGQNQVIRAYADILKDPTAHTVADVTLNDVPAGMSLCFRGKKEATTAPAAGQATYCDTGDADIPVTDDDGAFQFIGTPDTPEASPLDVDAFVRHAGGGGSDILSGRIRIDNIPFVVQGTFPTSAEAGNLDVGGFKRSGATLVADGIDRIEANIATFDLNPADTGYGANSPFEPKTNNISPFPVTATANQHLKAAVKDSEAQIRARIGTQSQLQRVRMLRSACPAPPNAPPDYPFFPDDGSKYTCMAGVFDPSAPNDLLDLGVHMEKDGSLISVADAGLSDIPGRFQVTLAETKLLNEAVAGQPLRRRCGPASGTGAELPGTTDCMPPLIRFDQPSQAVLFGTLRAGAASDLKLLEPGTPGAVVPREALANLDAAPTAGGFPGWGSGATCQANPDACGVRAKIVSFKGDRTAVKAGVRIGVPQSLTVNQIQSWSDFDKNGKPEYWEASDTRFHVVVRDSGGFAVGKLGQLAALKHSDDGTQILVSSPCTSKPMFRDNSTNPVRTSPDDCPEFLNGVPIPGELGIDIYQRNHTGDGKDFIQVDGRVSNPGSALNLGARVLGGGPKPAIGRLEGEVLNVPTVGPGVGSNDPSFRLRVQMLGEGEAPPTGPPAPGAGGGEEDSCSPFFCVKTEVRIKSVLASFNFLSARRVEAVVRQAGATKQGMEVKAYTGIRNDILTPITAKAFLDVNPINVFMHAGVPLLGGADFTLLSQLHAAVGLEQVKRFTLRHNTMHMKVSSEADAAAPDSRLGPINFYIYHLHGSAYALFVKLFGIDFFPPSLPPALGHPPGPPAGPVRLKFIDCNNAASFFPGVDLSPEPNTLRIPPNGSRNAVLWPFDPILEPRIHFSGLLGAPAKLISAVAGPFFCLTGADASDIPLPAPADPVGPTPTATSTRAQGHPVPDAAVETTTFTPPAQPNVTPPSYTVASTLALCGSHVFTNLTVNAQLLVATAASATETVAPRRPDCPAGEEGGLTLIAEKITVNGGGHIDGNHIVRQLGPPGGEPTGNSGGGHGGAGGNGSSGTGGAAFGDTTPLPVTEGGTRGRGFGPDFGPGGGAIVIRATDVVVAAGGAISANGGTGGIGAANCAGTKGSGGGGGSGGGIAIAAVGVVNNGTISANGGSGGSGGSGGGGGGGGGIVKIVSPLFTGNAATAGGGPGGAGLCGSSAGSGGGSFTPIVDGAPQSLPDSPANGKFWQRDSAASNLAVPVSAAASGGGANGMEVYLCGRHRTSAQVAAAFASATPPPDLNSVFPMPAHGPVVTGFGGVAPCGSDSLVLPTDSPLGSTTVATDRFNGTIATTGNLADGYHGFWTVVLRRPAPGFSCLVPFNFGFCKAEVLPTRVDLVLGVDNSPPSINITAPASGFETRLRQVNLSIEADDQADLSMLDKVECSNDGISFFACAVGKNEWPLAPGGDGTRTITARSTDVAGNSSTLAVSGLLDTTVPASSSALSGGVLGDGGWYRSPPTITLSGSDAGSGLANPAFAFRFDSGSETPCGPAPCVVPASAVNSLITGEHRLHFTAVDEAGNRLFDDEDPATPGPMNSRPIKIDTERPLSAFLTVPGGVDAANPNGANGWFSVQPLVTFSAVDQPGASGLVGTNAGIFYRVTSNGTPGPLTKFDGVPFALGPGQHTVCWHSVDLAGNVEAQRCRGPIKVDDAAPTIAIVPNPAAPNGTNGWYVTKPSVNIAAADATPGSGINAGSPPSGVFVSLDGRPFVPHTGAPITIGEGLHEVRAYTVDVSGQKSPIQAASFMVDLSKPMSAARVRPPEEARETDAALGKWWRRVPHVVLRSTDGEANAGVSAIEYKLDTDADFKEYKGPFTIPSGVHTITYRALDHSGAANQEPDRTLRVSVDVTPPVVRATSADVGAVWVPPPLGPAEAKLRWTVAEDLGDEIRPVVVVYNLLGQPVRRLVDTPRSVTPGGPAQTFHTAWDGKDNSLLGNVPAGVYYYRVIVAGSAGNVSMSGESAPLTIKAGESPTIPSL